MEHLARVAALGIGFLWVWFLYRGFKDCTNLQRDLDTFMVLWWAMVSAAGTSLVLTLVHWLWEVSSTTQR